MQLPLLFKSQLAGILKIETHPNIDYAAQSLEASMLNMFDDLGLEFSKWEVLAVDCIEAVYHTFYPSNGSMITERQIIKHTELMLILMDERKLGYLLTLLCICNVHILSKIQGITVFDRKMHAFGPRVLRKMYETSKDLDKALEESGYCTTEHWEFLQACYHWEPTPYNKKSHG